MKFLLKIALFTIIISALVLGAKLATPTEIGVEEFRNEIGTIDENSILFFGSSRIQRSVNDSLLNQLNPKHEFFNLGISGNTFLSNYLLAKYFLEKGLGGTMLIELSPISTELSAFSRSILDDLEISTHEAFRLASNEGRLHYLRLCLELANVQLMEKVLLKEDVKTILNVRNTDPFFGYQPSSDNNIQTNASILKSEEYYIHNSAEIAIDHYLKIIDQLISLGEKHNKKVIFMIPTTFRKKVEMTIVIPVYLQIPPKNKLLLDSIVLSKINHAELLLDINHFNSKGAIVYTSELSRLMIEQAIIQPPTQ